MAKKLVKYAFGNAARYASMKKHDQYTVYFVYNNVEDPITHKQVPGPYGTIYKGDTRIGSALASDIVFGTELKVTLLEGATEADSKFYTIEQGTSLASFASDMLKQTVTWDQELYADLIGYEGDGESDPGSPGVIRSIISDESRFDTAGNAEGIIADAINTRIADSIGDGPGNIIKAFLDSSNGYVSKDNLGKIQELAGILDDKTVELLINAASGIQEVLADYYTKDEAQQLLNNLEFHNTYDDFPEEGQDNRLYVDMEDSLLYRWGKEDPESETDASTYVAVGGSGGSAGEATVETKMFIEDGKTAVSIAKDTDYTIAYIFSSANTYTTYNKRTDTFSKVQQQTGTSASVTYSIDGVKFASGLCAQSNYYEKPEEADKNVYNHFKIPASKFTGTQHKIKIEATSLTSGQSASQEITINVVNVTINSSYNAAPASLANPITVPVTVSSTNSVTVYYKVDNDAPKEGVVISNGNGTRDVSVSNYDDSNNLRTPGPHKISVWAVTVVGDNELTTSTLDYNVLWYDPASELPIVSFTCLDELDNETQKYVATQYEYSRFRYQVYPGKGKDNIRIQLIAAKKTDTGLYEDNVINDLTVNKDVRNWSYIFDEFGEYQIYAKVIYGDNEDTDYIDSEKIAILVNKSEFAMDPVSDALLFMTAKDHDNDGSHQWFDETGTVEAILDGFAWTENSGWHNDASTATTSLRVANGAKCTIPFKCFEKNYASSGLTLEFDFSTSNLSNSEATLITCYSQSSGTGVTVTATGAYWETGGYKKTESSDTRIYVPFKEGERVRVSFVMTPMSKDDVGSGTHNSDIWNAESKKYETIETVSQGWWRFLKVYINGICVNVSSYTEDGGLSQSTDPSNIIIGSSEAAIDLYGVRFYGKTLYDREIVANYIADTQDPVEKVNIFKRNNILNLDGNAIDSAKLVSKIPCLFITCVSTSTYAGFTNNDHILPMSKADKRGFNVVFNCEQLDDEAKENFPWVKSFVAYNAQMQVQGTSSQYYPRKNYKLKFKTPKSGVAYEDAIATKKPTFLFVETTGNTYDASSGMSVEDFVKGYCETDDNAKYRQKGYKLRKYPDELEAKSVEYITSLEANAFCLKADFMESSSTHNTGMAKFVDFLSKNLGKDYLTPPQLAQYNLSKKSGAAKMTDVSLRTSIDGYPIAIFWRKTYSDQYTFLGKYNFNIDKGAEGIFGFIDNIEDMVNPYTGYNFVTFNEDYYDKATTAERQEYESPVECWEFTNNSTSLCKFNNVTEDSFRCASKLNSLVAEWTESFEARHPDNDLLLADYTSMVTVPTHWEALVSWISSTDRDGKHGDLRVGYEWKNSYDNLVAGAASAEVVNYINETIETLNDNPGDKYTKYSDKAEYPGTKFILAPYTEEQISDDFWEKTPSTEYTFYGYEAIFNETENKWTVGEQYFAPETEIDINKCYYIDYPEDTTWNGKLVVYDSNTSKWVEYSDISKYALDAPVVYGNVTYKYDTAGYRLAKFKYDLTKHMNFNATIFYYIMTEFFAQVDQRAKNLMFATWGYEPGAANVKPANAFASVEAADAAGYKPVYSYSLDTKASAPMPAVYGAAAKSVVINEVDCTKKKIELYNTTNEAISLVGWSLERRDETGGVGSMTFDSSSLKDEFLSISANGRIVLTAKGNGTKIGPSYGLSAAKEWLLNLKDDSSNIIDSLTNNKDGYSNPSGTALTSPNLYAATFGRETDGSDTIVDFTTPTIGGQNGVVEDPAEVQTPLPIYKEYTCEVPEFSGMCLKGEAVEDGFYAVSDSGKLYEVTNAGAATQIALSNVSDTVRFIGKNSDSGYSYISYSGDVSTGESLDTTIVPNTDFEAITKDADGNVYIMADYRTKSNYVVSLYIYKLVNNEGTYSLEVVTTVDTDKFFEGFTFKTGTTFLLGCKSTPGVYTIDLNGAAAGTPTSITQLTSSEFESLITEIADVCFDGTNIWTLDSVKKTVCKLSADGEFVEKYGLKFTEDNPEAMLVDIAKKELWIGCDNGNATSQTNNLIQVSLDGHLLGTSPVVVNECDPDNKWLELYNTTASAIDLKDYKIVKDDEEASAFTFSTSTIIPANGRIVLIVKNDGVAGPKFGMSNTKGFDYKIYDPSGKLIEHFDNLSSGVKRQIPSGCTLGRKTDGSQDIVLFKYHGSTGKSNSEGVLNSGIYINAIDSSGNDIGKRFEIYNSTSAEYDLTGHTFVKDGTAWSVVDTAIGNGSYTITVTIPPAEEGGESTTESQTIDCSLGLSSKIIPAGGYVIVQCNNTKANKADKTHPAMDTAKWPGFGLSSSKGYVLEIKDASGNIIDKVDNFHDSAANPNFIEAAYYGRVTDGAEEFVKFTADPIGVSNNSVEHEDRTIPVRLETSNIYINEINPFTDVVELYNAGDEAVSLGDYMLSKNFNSLDRWAFPADASISAHGFYTVNLKQYDNALGPIFGVSTSDFILVLSATTKDNIMDVVDNRAKSENAVIIGDKHSYGRSTDGGSEWVEFSTPSIGESNENGVVYIPPQYDFTPGKIVNHLCINELKGTDGAKYIELYNPTDAEIELGGNYALIKFDSDGYVYDGGNGECDWYIYPAGAKIASKGYYVCACKGCTWQGQSGTGFGLSFAPGKNFILRLFKVTASTNYSTIETIESTAELIDIVDNMTGKTVGTSDKYGPETFGRINDGSENWALFAGPGTIGSSNNTGTPIKLPEDPEASGPVGSKTVLYYVPKSCNYIYYPIFYDNDTMLSVNNTGYIIYQPNIESTDKVGSGYAYNGTESTLWLNFKDAFDDEIRSTYNYMRKEGGLNYANVTHFFNETQSDMWAENVYNMDAKFKYVDPATTGYTDFSVAASTTDASGNTVAVQGANVRDPYYLYECQGSRKTHRSWWLNNRFTYMDSRYYIDAAGTDYAQNYAVFRIYTPTDYNTAFPPNSSFALTPYANMYLRIKFGAKTVAVRAEKNKVYDVSTGDPTDRFNDTETMVYGAPYILSYGDLWGKYVRLANTGPSSRITELIFGAPAPYYNDNMENLAFNTANTALKYIDVRNCRKLNTLDGLNALVSLEELYATNTSLTGFDFNTTGVSLKKVAFPKNLGALTLINMPYLTKSGITFESLAKITKVRIESCPNLAKDSFLILHDILNTSGNKLSNLRIYGADWKIETKEEFDSWKKIIKLNAINEEGHDNSFIGMPYIGGTVDLGTRIISKGYKAGLKADMLANTGANLNIINGQEVSLNGITINGPSVITPKVYYTYTINYGPDDYVLDTEKGVEWEIPSVLTVKEGSMTNSSVTVQFAGSASGTESFAIKAKSTVNESFTASIDVRPSATLSSIRLYDSAGNEFNYTDGLVMYENETASIEIRFTPEDTLDTAVNISINDPSLFVCDESNNLPYSYSSQTRRITVTAAEVSKYQNTQLVVTSVGVSSVSVAMPISVNNIVSRIITLQDDTNNAHKRIKGYIDVVVDGYNSATPFRIFSDDSGVITLPTNEEKLEAGADESAEEFVPKFGLRKITVTPHASDENLESCLYNQPADIVFPELPETVDSDIEETVSFYKPVTATITVKNNGSIVNDAYLKITSNENSLIRPSIMGGTVSTIYNNVMIKNTEEGSETDSNNPATIVLLANTKHNIKIVETNSSGIALTSGKKYSDYSGIIQTGQNSGSASNINVEINIARDYLGDIEASQNTELHMVVATGETANTVRLYYRITGPIVIEWGDGETTSLSDDSMTDNTEHTVYHSYSTAECEYDISVKGSANSNTGNIRWFHVIPEAATTMAPCMGTGNNDTLFNTWVGNGNNVGGLVAYQSVGGADFDTLPRFTFTASTAKYSKLLCVGNIYGSCNKPSLTDASELFAYSTLEQIPKTAMFAKCSYLTNFTKTFYNTNITEFPHSFFIYNKRADTFVSTFEGCEKLGAIPTTAGVPFFAPDDDVEIKSVEKMFKGCTSVVSEVPEFWKTFYGCSFTSHKYESSDTKVTKLEMKTFEGCGLAANYSDVPSSWGGYSATPEFTYSTRKVNLKYIKMGYTGFGCFELNDITLDPTYKYVVDLGINANYTPYPGNPVFGAAHSTVPTGDNATILANIDRVIDFSINGWPTESGGGSHSGYFVYRLGESSTLNEAHVAQGANGNAQIFKAIQNGVLVNDYPTNYSYYKRVIIDICYKDASKLNVGAYSSAGTKFTHQAAIPEWTSNVTDDRNEVDWNVPMRLLSSYQVISYKIAQGASGTRNAFICEGSDRYLFYGMKIYDRSNNLIHDLKPVYLVISGNAEPGITDLVTNNFYQGTGVSSTPDGGLIFYKENLNETYE